MVKTPRTRHSRTEKDPVTIDLQPGEVSRVKAEAEAKEPSSSVETENEAVERAAADELQGAESTGAAQDVPTTAADTTPADYEAAADPATSETGQPTEKPSGASTSDLASDAAESSRTAYEAASGPAAEAGTGFGRAEAPVTPPPAPAGRRGAALAAGVAGGVIALLLAAGLQASGLLPGAADRSGEAAAIAGLETRIAELDRQIETLGAGPTQAFETRVAQAEERVAALETDLQAIRDEVDARAAQPGSGDMTAIEERIAALETASAASGGSTAPEAAAAAEEQIATLRQEISTLRDSGSQSAARLDSLEQALNDMSARVEENAAAPATAIVIAASALKAAIDRGMPFGTELDTYASLAPDASEVAELRQFAETGVPTLSRLVAESDAAADAMIAAARPVDPQAGFFDRLWGSAKGLVQVRPVGMVEGEGLPETVSRLDAAIQAGDLERALAEYETLPEAAKAAGAEFMAKVRARHTADLLVDQALASALRA